MIILQTFYNIQWNYKLIKIYNVKLLNKLRCVIIGKMKQ